MAMRLNPSWRDRFRRFAAADLDEIPHAEERAGQEHEYHPCDDIRHEQARQRLLASNGSVHDGFCFVVEPDGSQVEGAETWSATPEEKLVELAAAVLVEADDLAVEHSVSCL